MDPWEQVFRLLFGNRALEADRNRQMQQRPPDDVLSVPAPVRAQDFLRNPEAHPQVNMAASAAATPQRTLVGPTMPNNPMTANNPPNQGPPNFEPIPALAENPWDPEVSARRTLDFARNLGSNSGEVAASPIGADSPFSPSTDGPRVSEPIPQSPEEIDRVLAALDPTYQAPPAQPGTTQPPAISPSPAPNIITAPTSPVPASAPPSPVPQVRPQQAQVPAPSPMAQARPIPAPPTAAVRPPIPPALQNPMTRLTPPPALTPQVGRGGPSNVISMPPQAMPTAPTPAVVPPNPTQPAPVRQMPVPFAAELAGVPPELISQFQAQQPPKPAPAPKPEQPPPMRAAPKPQPVQIPSSAQPQLPTPPPQLGEMLPTSIKEQILAEAMRIAAANRMKPGESPLVPVPQGMR